MGSRLPYGGGFMQGGRSPLGRAIENIGSTFAQYFMKQGELRMQQGLNAQEQAKQRRAEVEALLESPDGPQDEAARRNLTMYMNSLDEVIGADPRQALELFEQTESIGVEVPTTTTQQRTSQIPGTAGGTDETGAPVGDRVSGETRRTVFDQVDVNRYVSDLTRQEAITARQREEGLLSDQEQLTLYSDASSFIEEMAQSGASQAQMQEYIGGLGGLNPFYRERLLARAGVGKVVNVSDLVATNPTHVAANLQAAMQPDGTFDPSKLPEGWAGWVQENQGYARQLVQQNHIAMEGAKLGLSEQTARTTAAFLENDTRRQELRQGAKRHEIDMQALENGLFQGEVDKVKTVLETGLGYERLSESEREQVDQALQSQGITLEDRQRSYLTKVRELDREATLRNTLTEANIDVANIQYDAAEYSLNRTKTFGEIEDDSTLVSVAVNASRTGDVATLQRYQSYLRDPAHADKAQRLRAAGINPAMLEDLLGVAQEVKADAAAQRQHNSEMRNAELQRVLTQGVEDRERTAATIASTFDSEEDARAYFEANPQQAEMLSSLGVLSRVYSDARYNDLKQGEAELWREVEMMTAERPDDIDSWNRARYERLLMDAGVSRKTAQTRAQGIIDAWERGASAEELQNQKDQVQMDMWEAQANAALMNARANQANARANETRANAEQAAATTEAAQTAFENSLDGLQELRQQQDDRRQTLMSKAQTQGCLIADVRNRLVLNPDAGPECGQITTEIEELGRMQDVVGQQIWELTREGANMFGRGGGIDTANPQEFASTSSDRLISDVVESVMAGEDVLPRQYAALTARLGEAEANRLIEERIAERNNQTVFGQ